MAGDKAMAPEARRALHAYALRAKAGHRRCANPVCPSCDNLPGGWAGWCVRCGRPDADERYEDGVCPRCASALLDEVVADAGGPSHWHMADALAWAPAL